MMRLGGLGNVLSRAKKQLVWVKNGIIMNVVLQGRKTSMSKYENGTQDMDPSGNWSFGCHLHTIDIH